MWGGRFAPSHPDAIVTPRTATRQTSCFLGLVVGRLRLDDQPHGADDVMPSLREREFIRAARYACGCLPADAGSCRLCGAQRSYLTSTPPSMLLPLSWPKLLIFGVFGISTADVAADADGTASATAFPWVFCFRQYPGVDWCAPNSDRWPARRAGPSQQIL